MALDGCFLHLLLKELNELAAGGYVDKIHQPAKDAFVLLLHTKAGSKRLFLSLQPGASRLHITAHAPENPAAPPMFCMLLRKHLLGARLLAFEQPALERVVFLRFAAMNEMGDRVFPSLVAEFLGQKTNLILLSEDGKIFDAVHRSDLERDGRVIQPGARYQPPAGQNKCSILETPLDTILARISSSQSASAADELLKTLDGVSPLVCRELVYQAARGNSETLCDARLRQALQALSASLHGGGRPVLLRGQNGVPRDFSFMPIEQYGDQVTNDALPSYSALLDAYYADRERQAHMHSKSQDMQKLLTTLISRTARKLNAWQADLEKCANREQLRVFGELLKANLYRVERGSAFVEVENYYDPSSKTVRIPLQVSLSPAANAARFFKAYKKTYTAEQTLRALIAQGELELQYLQSVLDALSRASSLSDLAEIREELMAGRYLSGGVKKQKQTAPAQPKRYQAAGFEILVGRNNRQNDRLTFGIAQKDDLWFHVKNEAGSHVILRSGGQTPPDEVMQKAAMLAAQHSKAAASHGVPVDYTKVRFVKKPAGAKPGMVVYTNHKTLFVTPEAQ